MKVHNSKLPFTINLLLEWKDVAQTASLWNQEKKKNMKLILCLNIIVANIT